MLCVSYELIIFHIDNDCMTNEFRLLLVLQWWKYELYNKWQKRDISEFVEYKFLYLEMKHEYVCTGI